MDATPLGAVHRQPLEIGILHRIWSIVHVDGVLCEPNKQENTDIRDEIEANRRDLEDSSPNPKSTDWGDLPLTRKSSIFRRRRGCLSGGGSSQAGG